MAAKKSHSRKTPKKQNPKHSKPRKAVPNRSMKKSAVSKRREQTQQMLKKRRSTKALILSLCSVFLFILYFLRGEKLWLVFHEIFRGIFGIFAFMTPIIILYIAFQYFKNQLASKFKLKLFQLSMIPVLLASAHFAFSSGTEELEGYFQEIYKAFINGADYNGSGVIGALLGIPLVKLMGSTGSGIIFIMALLIFFIFALDTFIFNTVEALKKPVKIAEERISEKKEVHRQIRTKQKEIKDEQRKKDNEEYIQKKVEETRQKVAHKKKKSIPENFNRINQSGIYKPFGKEFPEDVKIKEETPSPKSKKKEKEPEPVTAVNYHDGYDAYIEIEEEEKIKPEPKKKSRKEKAPEPSKEQTFVKLDKKTPYKPEPEPVYEKNNHQENRNLIIDGMYIKPPFNLLETQPKEKETNISAELTQRGTMLVETLKSFGVQTSIVNISRGPSVTRYELQPASGVKISKITNLSDDIAMNLAAAGVRIEAPIPGKSAVGVEVPNKHVSIVKMRNLVESAEFQNSKSKLTVALGMDITGKITLADLSKMPHLLIAGSTGSGKSVCINSMLVSLLYKSNPDEVKLMLIDPKVVELGIYNGIPHLLVPVVTDPRKAAGALSWAVTEMLERYKKFAQYNVRDMHSYNRMVERQNAEMESLESLSDDVSEERSFEEDEMLAQAQAELNNSAEKPAEPKLLEKMPQIVIVIDELADLMMAAPKDVEESICRLAQMARAAGMHLVIATQRPSVDVITGLIKANVPSRIAFAVKSTVDSRTILDSSGAEKLLGRGDMLFSPIGTTKPIRVQGCFVDDTEIEKIIEFIKKNKVVEYDESVMDEIERNAAADNSGKVSDDSEGDSDPMLEEAIKSVVEAGQASTSMLQRRLRVGYARAGRLIDIMEKMGIVGPYEGAKPRQVLMSHQEWLERNVNKP